MVKTRIKQIGVVVMLLIMAVCFCACGQINSSIITREDGSIEEIVTIELDVAKVVEAGYLDVATLKDEIKADAEQQAYAMKNNLNEKLSLHLSKPITEETRAILESYIDGISIFEADWKDNTYSIKVVFQDIDVYKYYYNISEDSKVEMQEEEHFFYNKVYWYGNTMYLKHRQLFDDLKAKYETKYPNLINHTDAELTYTYCADLRRQHSNADYIQKGEDGKYYHTWIIENPDEQIMFYYNVANAQNWIILSLLITLGITVIFTVVAIIIKIAKKNKKINKKIP